MELSALLKEQLEWELTHELEKKLKLRQQQFLSLKLANLLKTLLSKVNIAFEGIIKERNLFRSFIFERVEGVEPSSADWKSAVIAIIRYPLTGRSDWIRTSDLLVPNEAP